MARDPVVRFATDALVSGEKRKRKQTMTVLITITALFAVQIYTPAFAKAWPRMSGSGHVAFKLGGAFGNAGISVPQQTGEAEGGGELQSSENSQTQEVYGEYAISDHFLIVGKHLVQNTRLAAATRRTTYHEFGLQIPLPFLAFGLLPPGTLRALRFAFPSAEFARDTAAAAQIFHHHTYTKTHDAEGPASTRQDGGGLTFTIADRLSWKRYHLAQSLTVTQFNGWSSGIWKNDYEIHLGYAGQISLGWISEIYEDRDQSYASRNSYVVVGFSPSNYEFSVRVLRGENVVAGRPDTFRSYRLEVGWSFP